MRDWIQFARVPSATDDGNVGNWQKAKRISAYDQMGDRDRKYCWRWEVLEV